MGCGKDYLMKSPFGHVVLWHPSCQTACALQKKTSLTSFPVLGEVKLFDVKNACDEQSMLPCVLGEVKLFDVKNACDEQSMLPCLRLPCSLSFLLFEIVLKFL